MTMTAIASALASIRTLNDIARAMVDMRDAQTFQAKTIEFQTALINEQNSVFAANEERSALIAKISELEKEISQFRSWEIENKKIHYKVRRAHGHCLCH